MNNDKIMAWIDRLPNVTQDVLNHREALQSGIDEAVSLERQAAAIREQVKEGQERLLKNIVSKWTLHEIETASKEQSKIQSTGRHIFDPGLKKAVMARDGNLGPGGALEIYEREVLKNHAKQLATGNPETMQVLASLVDWWVHAGDPALRALRGGEVNAG